MRACYQAQQTPEFRDVELDREIQVSEVPPVTRVFRVARGEFSSGSGVETSRRMDPLFSATAARQTGEIILRIIDGGRGRLVTIHRNEFLDNLNLDR